MKMFSDADDCRSNISISEEQELRRKYEHLKKHGRINDINRIEDLERFIRNGVEYGYITVPDEDDPAYKIIKSVI